MVATMEIEAESYEQAKLIANDAPLPVNGEYLEDSFEIDND